MDLLSLLIAALLALGSSGAVTTDAAASGTNADATTASEVPPTDTTEARSHIIDLGNQ